MIQKEIRIAIPYSHRNLIATRRHDGKIGERHPYTCNVCGSNGSRMTILTVEEMLLPEQLKDDPVGSGVLAETVIFVACTDSCVKVINSTLFNLDQLERRA